jgi:hypothetical protein
MQANQLKTNTSNMTIAQADETLDCRGKRCPLPVLG